ncbi:MAG: pyruvate kinase [Campylobacteraceae bacterium]|nr:pyruvate kinase [Campylobacteraceae bacterium]
MNKGTKILATLGPKSDTVEIIEGLIRAGANMFRLNFSHGTHEYHLQTLTNIRIAMKNLNTIVGVLQDISGPKVRIGDLKENYELIKGDEITFVKKEIIGEKVSDKKYIMSINYPDLLDKVKEGEFIYLYDGTIRAKVIQTGREVIARIENNGVLGSRKGINFPNTVIDIDVITAKDEIDIAWGVENKVDFFAISFVQNKEDMLHARELLNGYNGKLIAKIEKFDAVENIDEILEASDGLMVARGDLGIEVPYYDVPTIQKQLIKKGNAVSKPVITATQMLLSMTTNERATRAEISDVANAVLDGTDVVMLSEESAIGIDPVNVVSTMSNIIKKTEEIYNYEKQYKMDYLDQFDVIQATATKLADDINAKGILALTSSGQSAIRMSRYRPRTPILAFTHKKKVLGSLAIAWGVTPVSTIKEAQSTKMIYKMLKSLDERGMLDRTGPYVATVGYPVGMPGSTNIIKILNESEISYYLNLPANKKK